MKDDVHPSCFENHRNSLLHRRTNIVNILYKLHVIILSLYISLLFRLILTRGTQSVYLRKYHKKHADRPQCHLCHGQCTHKPATPCRHNLLRQSYVAWDSDNSCGRLMFGLLLYGYLDVLQCILRNDLTRYMDKWQPYARSNLLQATMGWRVNLIEKWYRIVSGVLKET